MIPADMESILRDARTGGWDFFDHAPARVREAMERKIELADQDRRAIARAWAEFYQSPGGRKALELLFDMTLRRTVYFSTLGVDLPSMAVFGAFREGQNALAQEIARQIGAGLSEDVKPRD